MSEIVNSHEYWEKRFSEKDWKKSSGEMQSVYFAQLFKDNVPRWLVEQINENNLNVIDMGCAEGDGTSVLSEIFTGKIYGIDFSESAIEQAQKKYPDISFFSGDVQNLSQKWDVAFISNLIEHFQNPIDILAQVSQWVNYHMIIMIPFEEKPLWEEHEVVFDYNNIPIKIGAFNLIYFNNIMDYDEETALYRNQQILLVYSKDVELTQKISIAKSNNVIQQWISSNDYILFKENYFITKAALSNELEVSKKLYFQNEQLKVDQEIVEKKLEETAQCNALLNQEISDKENELKQTNQTHLIQLTQERERYDNLYAYSCKRDEELLNILNSRTYQFFVKWMKKPMSLTYRIVRKPYRLLKFLFTLNFKDLQSEITSPLEKISNRIKGVFTRSRIFLEIAESTKGKRVIVLPPTLDWHMPLFQRPQQLALAYSRKPDMIVIYMTKNIQYDWISVAEHPSENLWIVNELFLDKLCSSLKTAESVILSLSWTPNKFYYDKLKPDKLIYEYIDELEIFHMYGSEMEQDHQELMRRADVTVCTATKLYNQAVGKAKNPIISTNAGDYEFFAETPSYEINPLIKDLIQPYRCVLGYYGAVAKWFDYELVKEVAKLHPEWVWVIIGIDYDKTLGKSGFEAFENIVYVPPQPYKNLPSFLTAFDVATIPFLINEITLSTSPVKLFEYMAGGKPIITSRMPECLKYKSVMLYSNTEEFCNQVERILAFKNDDAYWTDLKKDALENTWDAKTDQILQTMEESN